MWITPRACSSPIRRKRRKRPCAPMRLRFSSYRRPSAARATKRSLRLPASTCAIWRPCSLPARLGRRHDAPSACLLNPACWPAATCAGRPSMPPRRGRASSRLWKPAPGSSQAERNAGAGHDWQDWTAIGGAGLFVTAFATTRLKSGFPEGNCDVGTASSWPHNQKSPCRKSLQGLSRSLEPTERLELSTC